MAKEKADDQPKPAAPMELQFPPGPPAPAPAAARRAAG